MEHFAGEGSQQVAALQELRCGDSVAAFNAAFTKKAASAVAVLGDYGIKQLYLQQLRPESLKLRAGMHMNLPLQQLMARVVECHALERQSRGSSSNPSQRPQNPDRRQCSICRHWYNPKTGQTCACRSSNTGGARGTNNRSGSGKPRAQEAVVEEVDLAPSVVEEGEDVDDNQSISSTSEVDF